MAEDSPKEHKWSDADLVKAVATSTSWRGVMRILGLCVTSTGSIHVVKRHVALLGLDTSHFTGQRMWSDAKLIQAAAHARSWNALLAAMEIKSTSRTYRTRVKAHAVRLGLDLSHLDDNAPITTQPPNPKPALANLRDAATMLASSWFSLCGFATAIPVEPAIHDLLVSMPDGIKRVQVKTTTYSSKSGWQVGVGRRPYSAGNREGLVPYDPDVIDCFSSWTATSPCTSFPVRSSRVGSRFSYGLTPGTSSAVPPGS
jgi:hypothetical protein